MPGPEFFQTRMGHRFFESTLPRLVDVLEKIAKELELKRIKESTKQKEGGEN